MVDEPTGVQQDSQREVSVPVDLSCRPGVYAWMSAPLSSVVLAVLLAMPVASAAQQGASPGAPATDSVPLLEPGSELTISLLTFGPGDEVWEPFGHNALRIQNAQSGRDDVFHWGVFSFSQIDFLPRFIRGEMLYSMGYDTFESTLQGYQSRNRSVWSQELNLTPAQRFELQALILENTRNPDYRYDYFLQNCSTRIRDLLDQITGGALEPAFREQDGESYRFHTRRLTEPHPLIWTGLDLLLGPRGDEDISRWEAAFVPMVLRDEIRSIETTRTDERPVPLVASEEEIFVADREPAPAAPIAFNWPLLALGLGMAVLIVLAGQAAGEPIRFGQVGLGLVGSLWSLIAGGLGAILVLVWFTEHIWMYFNENILQFNPVSLLLVFMVPFAAFRQRPAPWTQRFALAAVAFSLVGFLVQVVPGIDQANGELIALALPLHGGVFLAVRAMNRRRILLPAEGPQGDE